MNDRRPPYDGSDDDAIFADIVAHLNDDAEEPGGVTVSPAEEGAGAVDRTDQSAQNAQNALNAQDEAAGEIVARAAGGSPGLQPAEEPPTNPVPWPTSPPTALPEHQDSVALPNPQVWRAHDVDDELEEHFEPPPVTPLPAGDLQFWAIIAGMAGGPLLLLYLVFFNREASSYWTLIAIAMAVGGFGLLVSRMPGHDDDDDGARL